MAENIGVCAILVNDRNQVLVGRRKNSYKEGLYGFPGGRLEVVETIKEAIIREVIEETGVKLESDAFVYLGVVRENQDDHDFIHFVYLVKHVVKSPKLMEPDKCEGWEWKEVGEVEDLLPGHEAALRLYTDGISFIDMAEN